jgi:hypothetical protein
MGLWTEYASRNNSICGQNFLLEIAVFRDRGSNLIVDLIVHCRFVII